MVTVSQPQNVRSSFMFSAYAAASTNAVQFSPINSSISDTVEANIQITVSAGLAITRFRANVWFNSKNASTTIGFRDDGVTITSIAVGAAVTGQQDSGDIELVVAAGSKLNFLIDTSASASGSLGVSVLSVEYRTL